MTEHKFAELLRHAADNEDAWFHYQHDDGSWDISKYQIEDVLQLSGYNWRIYQPPKHDVVEYASDYIGGAYCWQKSLEECSSLPSTHRIGIIRRTINGETGKASICYVDENGEEV